MPGKKPTSPDPIKEFQHLFLAARNEHRELEKKPSPDGPAHQAALAYAKKHKLTGAEILLQASLLDWQGKSQEALDLLEAHQADIHTEIEGVRWFLQGAFLGELGQGDAAIEAFHKALADPNFHAPGKAWLGLGLTYYQANKYQEARNALQKVLALPDTNDNVHTRTRILLQIVKAELKPKALSRDDRALLEPLKASDSDESADDSGPEPRILSKLREANESQYDKYLKEPSSQREDTLSILRGWSSAVTLVEGSERLWRGGGYLLKWQGKGIAIDPGFDFLRNLHDAQYHGREIDAVLVSHNHPDHNYDLKSVDDLRYELYKRRASDKPDALGPYTLLWDRDSDGTIIFSSDAPQHQYRPMLFDRGRCNPEDTIKKPHDLPFSATYFEARHGKDVPHAVGFRLTLHDGDNNVFTLGYTGDTGFFPELADRLKDCDILLAHISQPDAEEFTNPNHRKKIHLGYRGLAELISLTQPKLTLVGEFWAGLADLRIDLVQGLRRLSGTEAILPAGIGLHLKLPEMTIECSECKQPTPFKDIRVAPPASRFENLSYLCSRCLLT